jgi:hypothetical protein
MGRLPQKLYSSVCQILHTARLPLCHARGTQHTVPKILVGPPRQGSTISMQSVERVFTIC